MPVADLPKLDLAARFSEYVARDAAWAEGQPLAVNRDFDFSMAFAIDSVGAGLAAKRRRDGNEELAKQLAARAPLDPAALLQGFCAASPHTLCNQLAGKPIRIYGLLWGDKAARLLVVLEVAEVARPFAVHASVSDARPLAEFLEPGALGRTFDDGLAALAKVFDNTAVASTTAGACKLSPGSKLTGHVLVAEPAFTLLAAETPIAPRVLCPSDATEAALAAPERAAGQP